MTTFFSSTLLVIFFGFLSESKGVSLDLISGEIFCNHEGCKPIFDKKVDSLNIEHLQTYLSKTAEFKQHEQWLKEPLIYTKNYFYYCLFICKKEQSPSITTTTTPSTTTITTPPTTTILSIMDPDSDESDSDKNNFPWWCKAIYNNHPACKPGRYHPIPTQLKSVNFQTVEEDYYEEPVCFVECGNLK